MGSRRLPIVILESIGLDALLPAGRRNTVWATSNLFAPEVQTGVRYRGSSLLLSRIDQLSSRLVLMKSICPAKTSA